MNYRSVTRFQKKTASFFIVRDKFIYTIFYTGHINCTGIKRLSDINESVSRLMSQLNLTLDQVKTVKIDSILAASRISNYVNLTSFAHFLRQRNYSVQYNPQRFPGLCIRKFPGCVLTFISGKVIFSGPNSEEILHRVATNFFKLYDDYCNM